MPEFIEKKEVAARLKITPVQLLRLARQGRIRSYKVSPKKYRFIWEEVEEDIRKRKAG